MADNMSAKKGESIAQIYKDYADYVETTTHLGTRR